MNQASFKLFFHDFFCFDADALFPNMNDDVCLSAPVVLEMDDESPNTIWIQMKLRRVTPVITYDPNAPQCYDASTHGQQRSD